MHVIVCACALMCAPCGDSLFPLPHDVIIHEIMADPSPPVSLPEYEFIELRNLSPRTINLAGWKVRGNGGSATLPAFSLAPGGYVVVSPRKGVSFFQPVVDAGSFFALHNEEDLLSLESPSGNVIHAVTVDMRPFSGSFKSFGGWSLEMKDPAFPCAGAVNWAFSNDPSGGTPGRANSVAAQIPEPPLPALVRSSLVDSLRIRLHFSAPLDSAFASAIPAYVSERAIAAALPEPPAYQTVLLELAAPMPKGTLFQLRTSGLKDCTGRAMPASEAVPCGRSSHPENIVITEILPDPAAGTEDFLEVHNKGRYPVELAELRWAVRADDGWKAPSPVVRRPWLLFPGEYLALSPAPEALCRQYACLGRVEAASVPALSAESGRIGLFSVDGRLLDEALWDRKLHDPGLAITKGVAFERLDFNVPGIVPSNWYSAASTAGFGTPGYANSHRAGDGAEGTWCSLVPGAFRPDNDGLDDLAWIHWEFPAPGFRLDVRIFDAAGRPVRHLANNISAADKGKLSWNGLADNGLPLPKGSYAVKIAAWNGNGQQLSRKLAVVLLRD